MKNNILVSAILISFFATLNINAQSTKTVLEDVILFNSEPYMVRMTEKGKIIAFMNDVSNTSAALNSVTAKSVQLDSEEIDKSFDLARANGNTLDQEGIVASIEAKKLEQEEEMKMIRKQNSIPQDAMAIAEMAPEDEMMAKGEIVEDNVKEEAKTNYDYEFAFDHRDATLSPSSVNQLNEIAKILNSNEASKIDINSYFSETVDVSKILSKNRAKGIEDMLVSKGIDRSRINISESNNKDWANNRVKVSIH